MADTSRALILRFGADTGALRGALSALASEAPRHLTAVGQAAVVNSALLRNSLISAGAEGTRTVSAQLLGLARDTDHLRLAANLAGEGLKTAFALHHPVLAIGLKLLSDYKIQLGLIAAGAITAHEAFKIMADQFERVNQIIEGSMKAGVSPTVFQAWTDQAARFGLTAKEAEAALDHIGQLAKRELSGADIGTLMRAADELQNGMHRATAAYGELREATTSDDVHHAALVLVEDYLKAADAMRASGQEAKGARLEIEAGRLASEAWGDAAYKVVDAIKSGRADISGYVQSARDAGYVWGEDIVRAQKDSNELLRIARERLSNEMAPTMRGLAEDAIWFQNIWAKIVDKIASAVAWVNRLSDKLGMTSKSGLGEADALFASEDVYARLPKMRNLAAENALGESAGPVRAIAAPSPPRRPSQRQLEAPSLGHEHSGAAGGSAARESLDQVERLVQSLEKENAALQGETNAIGKSSIEREKSIDLAKAEEAAKERGSALTEEERTKVLALAEAHATLRKKVDDARKAQEEAEAARKQFADMGESSVERLIVEHQKLADVLKDIVKELEKMALKAVLTGQGPLAGLFGTAGQNGAAGGLFGLLGSGGQSLFSGLFSNANFAGQAAGAIGPFPQAEGGGGLLGFLGGLFGFANGGLITMAHLPRYAGGGPVAPDGGFPILAHPGEIVLNAAQQRNVAGGLGGQGQKIVFENHAPGVTVQPAYATHGEVRYMIQSEVAANNDRQSLAPLQAW